MKRSIVIILTLLVVLSATGFAVIKANEDPVADYVVRARQERINNPENKKLIDSAIGLLRTGDIVLRKGADITSYMLSEMNRLDKTFSHCGIVIIENGYPFIYHSIGGEDNPDQELKRDSALFWFSPANNLAAGVARHHFSSEQVEDLLAVVRKFYKEKRKFDMNFDLASNDRLYCAEFAYKAINQAMKDTNYIRPVSFNGYRYVGTDNLYLTRGGTLICRVQYK
jgi:hypothetical protein